MPRKGQPNKFKDMTYEEIYGKEKAGELRELRRKHMNSCWGNEAIAKKMRDNMSMADKLKVGEKNGFYGKKHTKKTKKIISQSKLGKPSWNKGKTGIYSESVLKKMSEAASKRTGDKNPNWRGGETIKYADWRKRVFNGDYYTCQRCLAKSGKGNPVYLQAHHIIPVTVAPEEKYESDNGVTLCKNCHGYIHIKELSGGFNALRL